MVGTWVPSTVIDEAQRRPNQVMKQKRSPYSNRRQSLVARTNAHRNTSAGSLTVRWDDVWWSASQARDQRW